VNGAINERSSYFSIPHFKARLSAPPEEVLRRKGLGDYGKNICNRRCADRELINAPQ